MKAYVRCRIVSLCLVVSSVLTTGDIYAQCSGFPATTADADCASGTTVSNNANINSGTSYGFCGPNSTTYTYNVNLNGGVLRICGNANITGNFNSGVIVVSCGATANFTSGLTMNSNVGIVNYGTVNVTGSITFQNNGNYVYNESSTSVLKVSGDVTYPANNGQNAYIKNSGYIKINGTFYAYQGGYTCFMDGGLMDVNNLTYYANCAANTNHFTFGSSSGTAIVRYSGTATLKSSLTASSYFKIYQGTGSTASLSCNGSWGSATTVANQAALTAPSSQSCTSVSTCWNTLASTGLGLSARLNGSRIELDWSTQTESHTDYFEVQKSTDGSHWERLTTVTAKGNSTSASYYRTYDNKPGSGTLYYRVILTSLDGMEDYSTIVAISGVTATSRLSVYPNPGTGSQITLTGWADLENHVFTMYNSQGQRVYAGTAQNGVALTIPRLAKGIYFIVADLRRVSYIQE